MDLFSVNLAREIRDETFGLVSLTLHKDCSIGSI